MSADRKDCVALRWRDSAEPESQHSGTSVSGPGPPSRPESAPRCGDSDPTGSWTPRRRRVAADEPSCPPTDVEAPRTYAQPPPGPAGHRRREGSGRGLRPLSNEPQRNPRRRCRRTVVSPDRPVTCDGNVRAMSMLLLVYSAVLLLSVLVSSLANRTILSTDRWRVPRPAHPGSGPAIRTPRSGRSARMSRRGRR